MTEYNIALDFLLEVVNFRPSYTYTTSYIKEWEYKDTVLAAVSLVIEVHNKFDKVQIEINQDEKSDSSKKSPDGSGMDSGLMKEAKELWQTLTNQLRSWFMKNMQHSLLSVEHHGPYPVRFTDTRELDVSIGILILCLPLGLRHMGFDLELF